MIKNFPFMLRPSKHSGLFFSNLFVDQGHGASS
jgi:hypothetical protein